MVSSAAIDTKGHAWVWGSLQGEDYLRHARIPRKLFFDGKILSIRCGLTHNTITAITSAALDSSSDDTSKSKSRKLKLKPGLLKKKRPSLPLALKRKQDSIEEAGEEDESSENAWRKESSSLPSHYFESSEAIDRFANARNANALDRNLISDSDKGDLVVDYGEPGLSMDKLHVQGCYRSYETLFIQNYHYLYIGRSAGSSKVVGILRYPDPVKHCYFAIVFEKTGIFITSIAAADIVGTENLGLASPRNLADLFLRFLCENWTDLEQHITRKSSDPFVAGSVPFVRTQRSESSSSGGSSSTVAVSKSRELEWTHIASSKDKKALSARMLVLEARLGKSQRLNVGVFFHTNDKEKKGDDTFESAAFKKFLRIISNEVPGSHWKHFDGGMSNYVRQGTLFYTSWRGFEIVFHVSTRMNADLRRQFIANDKVVIHFADPDVTVAPEFRGKINSVGLVVRYVADGDTFVEEHNKQWKDQDAVILCDREERQKKSRGWRVGSFSRSVVGWKPIVSTSLICDKCLLRDTVLANVVNATAAVQANPPFCNAVIAAMADEIESVAEQFTSGKKGKTPLIKSTSKTSM